MSAEDQTLLFLYGIAAEVMRKKGKGLDENHYKKCIKTRFRTMRLNWDCEEPCTPMFDNCVAGNYRKVDFILRADADTAVSCNVILEVKVDETRKTLMKAVAQLKEAVNAFEHVEGKEFAGAVLIMNSELGEVSMQRYDREGNFLWQEPPQRAQQRGKRLADNAVAAAPPDPSTRAAPPEVPIRAASPGGSEQASSAEVQQRKSGNREKKKRADKKKFSDAEVQHLRIGVERYAELPGGKAVEEYLVCMPAR
eukprot:99171-Rhodomonas_salina.2